MREIGRVVQYLANPSVAVVELVDAVAEGERVLFGDQETTVTSMQKHKERITQAEAGDAVGIQVPWEVEPNTRVYATQ